MNAFSKIELHAKFSGNNKNLGIPFVVISGLKYYAQILYHTFPFIKIILILFCLNDIFPFC